MQDRNEKRAALCHAFIVGRGKQPVLERQMYVWLFRAAGAPAWLFAR